MNSNLIKTESEGGFSDSEPIVCAICGYEFTLRKNLYCHLRTIHEIEPLLKRNQNRVHQCNVCNGMFSTKSTLAFHKKRLHPSLNNDHDYNVKPSKKSRLLCPYSTDCTETSLTYLKLREHLRDGHGFEVESVGLIFETFEDFQKWKFELEQTTISKFVSDTSLKTTRKGFKAYYNCSRSYSYRGKSINKRPVKRIGSNKTNVACPARIEVKTIKNVIEVTFYRTHCGHDEDLKRIPLDKGTRSKIAAVLQEGFTFNQILDVVVDMPLMKHHRLQLLDRKDLHNIVRDFKINYDFNNGDGCFKDLEMIRKILDPDVNPPDVFYLDNDCTELEVLEERVGEQEEVEDLEETKKRLLEKIETVTSLVQTVELPKVSVDSIEIQLDQIIDIFFKPQ